MHSQLHDPDEALREPHVFFTTLDYELETRHLADKRVALGRDAQTVVPPCCAEVCGVVFLILVFFFVDEG